MYLPLVDDTELQKARPIASHPLNTVLHLALLTVFNHQNADLKSLGRVVISSIAKKKKKKKKNV